MSREGSDAEEEEEEGDDLKPLPSAAEAADGGGGEQGHNSIEKNWLDVWLEMSLGFLL